VGNHERRESRDGRPENGLGNQKFGSTLCRAEQEIESKNQILEVFPARKLRQELSKHLDLTAGMEKSIGARPKPT
jgi:hypothetical protein